MRPVAAAKRVGARSLAPGAKRLHVGDSKRLVGVGEGGADREARGRSRVVSRTGLGNIRQTDHLRDAGFTEHGHEAADHLGVLGLVATVFPNEQQVFGEGDAHDAIAFRLELREQSARQLVADDKRPLAHHRQRLAGSSACCRSLASACLRTDLLRAGKHVVERKPRLCQPLA